MIIISENVYRSLADRLVESIGSSAFFNGSVELDMEEIYTTLRATLIVHRKSHSEPTGDVECITEIVPVWWEYSTVDATGEQCNDFSWRTFLQYLN